MKKSILLLGVAVAAMTSCSNDKLLDQAEPIQRAIGFESWINKPTKAVNDITEINLKEFNVFGYYTKDNAVTTVFTNTPVLNNASEWNVTEQVLWTNNAYAFAAYAYGSGNSTNDNTDKLDNIEFKGGNLTITNFSLGEDKDLIAGFATVDAINADAIDQREDVEIDFKHLLSKVSFKFTYVEENTNIKVQITDISLNVPLTATCTATKSATTWADHTGDKKYSFTDDDESKFEAITYANSGNIALSEEFYVLPNEIEGAELTFTATYMDKTQNDAVVRERTYTLPLTEGTVNDDDYDWIANNVYQYNVSLPFSPLYIDFTVGGITDWASPANIVNISPEDTSVTSETGE